MNKLFEFVLDLVYPPKCVFCGKVIDKSDICIECKQSLPYTKGDSIHQKFAHVDKCFSPLYYKDNVRESVLRYKFGGRRSYFKRYAVIMAECAENNLDCGSIDMISCIPLGKKRLRQRGYNQAELIAKRISQIINVPYEPTLRKVKNNPAQSGISDRRKRAENVNGVYAPLPNADVEGKHILLIDDVVTTGATVSECAKTLKKMGAKKVYCVTLARHED